MTTKTVRNAWDAYTDHATPAHVWATVPVLRTSNVANKQKHAFLFFTRPFPIGSNILSAKLHMFLYQDRQASPSVTVQRVSESFNRAKLTWNNEPGVAGAGVSVTKNSPKARTEYVFDVTDIMQTVSNGTPWYGFRVSSSATSGQVVFFSTNAGNASMRPYLEVTWSQRPDTPDQLQPSGGRLVSTPAPVFSFHYNDPAGQDGVGSVHVQVASTEALLLSGTPDVWDSGVVPSDSASLDSAQEGWTGGVAGTTYWWRVQVTDDTGQTSDWSDPETFGVLPLGNLAAQVDDNSGHIMSTIPTVSWTFTGQTQKSFQVFVADAAHPAKLLHDSGKKTTTDTTYGIPEGVITDDSKTYRITLHVYDTQPRQGITYVEWQQDLTVGYGATAPVTNLDSTSDPILPTMHLTWQYAGSADTFQIQYRDSEDLPWKYEDLVDPDDALQDDGTYACDSDTGAMYRTFHWRVVPIMGGIQSSNNPETIGQIRRLAPFLMSADHTQVVCFMNASRTRQRNAQQQLLQPVGGPPVLYTQYVGPGDTGHVEGVFADNTLPGYTAKQMHDWFMAWADAPGTKLKLVIANETLTVAAYNMQCDSVVDGEGVYYSASFDWVVA